MTKVYIETTVLTDSLLLRGTRRDAVIEALDSFTERLLPVYSIKEFKAGPLSYFAWFHNKLISTETLPEALDALQTIARGPQKYRAAGSIQALANTFETIGAQTIGDLVQKYGSKADHAAVVRDEARLHLKSIVLRAWKNRRKLATTVVDTLSCYNELDLTITRHGLIKVAPTKCETKTCCMAAVLAKRKSDLQTIKDVNDKQSKLEHQRRSKALRHLIRTPGRDFSDGMCRNLGDAVFALYAPVDAVILTTNLRDISPLASALGKTAQRLQLAEDHASATAAASGQAEA